MATSAAPADKQIAKLLSGKKYDKWLETSDLDAVPVNVVPGCGWQLGLLMKQDGIQRASQLYEHFKKMKPDAFAKHLSCKFGPRNRNYARAIITAFQDWDKVHNPVKAATVQEKEEKKNVSLVLMALHGLMAWLEAHPTKDGKPEDTGTKSVNDVKEEGTGEKSLSDISLLAKLSMQTEAEPEDDANASNDQADATQEPTVKEEAQEPEEYEPEDVNNEESQETTDGATADCDCLYCSEKSMTASGKSR
jgi:hypothetical protein